MNATIGDQPVHSWWDGLVRGVEAVPGPSGGTTVPSRPVPNASSSVGKGDSDAVSTVTSTVTSLWSGAQNVLTALSSSVWWVRVGIGAAGVLLLILGLITILVSSPDGRKAVGAAASAAVL